MSADGIPLFTTLLCYIELGKLGKYLENLAIRDIRSEAMQSKSCISAPGPVGWSHQGLRRLEIALSDIHIRLAVLEKPLCSTDDDPFRQGFLSLPGVCTSQLDF